MNALLIYKPITYRKYPPIPNKCRMIDDSLENSTICTNNIKNCQYDLQFILFTLLLTINIQLDR
ncbi:hypothetical protein MN116_007514 [Schistosoma mekongi]|uniref:Uncharacterized protein n=1 Tax=Schistosoma mekongi TaxID=38744 RepID=A0AAE1Z7M7_SCHME|nr:hypothetical protein MN116_007514 [Schistosoma mekongi]